MQTLGQKRDHISAHKHSRGNRAEIEASIVCGCFYCSAIFPPSEILEWQDDGQTAVCPRCPVDSVIGLRLGLSDQSRIPRTHAYHWF